MAKTAHMRLVSLAESIEEDWRLLGLQVQLLRWAIDQKRRRGTGVRGDKRPGEDRGRQGGRPTEG